MTPREIPSTAQLLTPVAGGALMIALVASLSGCAAIEDTLHKVHREQHATYAAAEAGWVGVGIPSWIPEDATDLRNYATLNESNSIVGVTTESDPIGCAPAERRHLPFSTPDWAPENLLEKGDGSLITEVLACGDYEVVAVDGGLVGWFSATEEGQTPR